MSLSISATDIPATDLSFLLFKHSATPGNPALPLRALGYRGEWTDPTTGQQYLRARHYDPKVGRFTSLDPRDAGPGDLGNANLYVYAANDPINFADPTGLFTRSSMWSARPPA